MRPSATSRAGVPWIVIGLLTGLLNARHVLYSAALAPWFRGTGFGQRAVAAHVLTDESFALSIAHFRRLGRFDAFGYWFASIGVTFIPWFLATLAGALLGEAIVDPERLGIDVIFPAAMIGLAVGLISGRRELVAAVVGAAVGVGVSLAVDARPSASSPAASSGRPSGSSCRSRTRARPRRSARRHPPTAT